MDWTRLFLRLRELIARMPRIGWLAAAAVLLALAGVTALSLSGPGYAPLFEGLSPGQGGRVIDALQKLGIPYQLNATGSIIEVPRNTLARARLKLGEEGVPASPASSAWKQLTHDSVTTSATAERALSQRATESTLEQAIERIHGVAQARVMLARPRETPFLESQPRPKASVLLTTSAGGISQTQARAIAQLVANAVPGLDASRVTVTDQDGQVLAPISDQGVGQAQSQLAFEDHVETETGRHIRALLNPVVGAENLRVSVAAGIDFAQRTSQQVTYGPQSAPDQVTHDQRTRVGQAAGSAGVPGALSNQPPGNTTAPVGKRSPGSGKSARKQGTVPGSRENRWNVRYEVGKTVSQTHAAPWTLKSLSVSVVVNRNAVKTKQSLDRIRALVRGSLAAPRLSVDVVAVPFRKAAPATTPAAWMTAATNPALIRAALELLAAVLLLFGVARPLGRWLQAHAESLAGGPRPATVPTGVAGDGSDDGFGSQAARTASAHARQEERRQTVQALAAQEPDKAAELIRRWMQQDQPGSGERDPGPETEDPEA